jgi:hypothetical protein
MENQIERWFASHINGFAGEVRMTQEEAQADATKYNDETMIPLAKAEEEDPVLATVVHLIDASLLDEMKSVVSSLDENRKAQKRELKALTAQLEIERKAREAK